MQRWLGRAQVSVPLLWAGLVIGLSFIEAPLKFRAPGVTRELGLGIGRLMFDTLGRIELVLALVVLGTWLPAAGRLATRLTLTLVIGIVAVQAGWLLPSLDAQAAAIIAGAPPSASFQHGLFAVLEAVKVAALILLVLQHPLFSSDTPELESGRSTLPTLPRLPSDHSQTARTFQR